MALAALAASMLTAAAGCVIDPTQTVSDSTEAPVTGMSVDAGAGDAKAADAGAAADAKADARPADAGQGDAGAHDAATTSATTPISWLPYVNIYRAQAALPALTEDATLSAGDVIHAKYIVQSGTIAHAESTKSPYYTKTGDTAGQSSNVAGGTSQFTQADVIDSWMAAPFHAVGILDPRLTKVGYGDYYDGSAKVLKFGAALDVLHGRVATAVAKPTFPVMWPGDKQVVPLHQGVTELPDPLTGCKGYSAPFGLPIVLQLGTGGAVPKVAGSTLQISGRNIDHCRFDETSYTNPDAASQAEVRSVLNTRNAIVIIPRDPLSPGVSYRVTVASNGATYTWVFAVSSTVRD